MNLDSDDPFIHDCIISNEEVCRVQKFAKNFHGLNQIDEQREEALKRAEI